MSNKELFTARGRLLIRVIEKPGTTVKELASDLFLTKRSIWGIVGELRQMGYLVVKRDVNRRRYTLKDGRTHHYYVTDLALAELRKLTEGKGKW